MKNILFATTALIATAGFAAAEVSLSGSAEMGIIGGDQGITQVPGPDNDQNFADQFHTDIDVKFTLSGESDNGITFGATIDLDEEGGFGNTNGGPESVFISGDFGTLTMGDTDGALDKALTELDLIADISDANTSHNGFNGNSFMDGIQDGQIARFDYSIAGFDLALSAETDDLGVDRSTWGFGAKYTLALGATDVKLGAGFQGGEDQEGWGLSVDTSFAGVRAVVNYSEAIANVPNAFDTVTTHGGLGLLYETGALSVGANYGEFYTDGRGAAKGVVTSGYGIAANYDLGGGLVAQAGFGEGITDSLGGGKDDSVTSYSLGLAMSF